MLRNYNNVLCSYSKKFKIILRNKHKDTHWSVQRKKIQAKDKALDHFNDFYKQVFTNEWPSIRQALLGKQKYVAVINNYGDAEETIMELENSGALNMRRVFHLQKEYINEKCTQNKRVKYLGSIRNMTIETEQSPELSNVEDQSDIKNNKYSLEASLHTANYNYSRLIDENVGLNAPILSQFLPATEIKGKDDWISQSDHYKYYEQGSNVPINIKRVYDIHFPQYLNVLCYEKSNYADFKSPKRGLTNVYNYYLMDGSCVLPVLALDLKPGQTMLDMCAAPGGKSLIALQTLYPDCVVCNDVSSSRVNRIFNVLEQYFYDLDERWIKPKRLKVTNIDGRAIEEKDFDRILVDVPCTTDRLSVNVNENNIFKSTRIRERLRLPELQCELLVQALKLVRKGGIVVYSTCSLSPIQNDGVVRMALKRIWEETDVEIAINDLSLALAQVQNVFKMADHNLLKYGHLVVPSVPQNYGPMYFCKLERIK